MSVLVPTQPTKRSNPSAKERAAVHHPFPFSLSRPSLVALSFLPVALHVTTDVIALVSRRLARRRLVLLRARVVTLVRSARRLHVAALAVVIAGGAIGGLVVRRRGIRVVVAVVRLLTVGLLLVVRVGGGRVALGCATERPGGAAVGLVAELAAATGGDAAV